MLLSYLQSQQIQARYVLVRPSLQHGIELLDPAQQSQARLLTEEFIANPQQQKYQEAAWQSGETVTLAGKSWFSLPLIVQNLRQHPLTSGILLLCLLIYCLAFLGITAPYGWLRILPWPQLVESQQWWRLIGPALIHFSLLHIVFNLMWWWMLGKQLEVTFGKSTLLLLFLFTAITSNFAQLLISGPNFGGLSGVVYGLVGCVWWLGWLKPAWGIGLPKPVIGFLLVWLLIGYADVLWIHMANTAHTVGLISGCLFAFGLSRIAPADTRAC